MALSSNSIYLTEGKTNDTYTHEGFYEDLAHQYIVAHLFQLQLGFRRCRIWVSVLSHMGSGAVAYGFQSSS